MVLFVIFCPIAAAVLILVGAPARKTALAASALMFAAALFLFGSFGYGQRDFQHVTSFTISPDWRLSFTTGVDGLSLIMVLLATIITLAAVWFAGTIEKYENAFYACLLFISGGAIGAFVSVDLFFFYSFHELALIPTFFLVSLFPFHTWAPEAYASAPAPAAMLHAGVLKKFGVYGFLRLAIPLLPEGARHWSNLLMILLLGNIIYIGLVTIAQKRLDWMLGYSSVMHMGYIFLGIASAGILGVTGAAVLMFAHGLSIALLFALAG